MKSIISTASLLFAFAAISFAQSKDGFDIQGTVPKNVEGKKVYLKTDGSYKAIDSTIVKNGQFSFKGKTDYPQLYNITIEKTTPKQRFNYAIPLFVENTEIKVKAALDSNTTELELLYAGGYPYEAIRVSGTHAHSAFLAYIANHEPLKKKYSAAFDNYIKYLNPGKGKQKEPISVGIKLVDEIDASKLALNNYIKKFIKEHSVTPIAVYAAQKNIGSFTANEIDEILSLFPEKVKQTAGGKAFLERAAAIRKTAVGAKYVDFAFNDHKGNPTKISDHIVPGKYTLLEFWASWCGPCRADIPHLKEAYQLYHPSGFNVVSISMDDDKEKWLKAINEEQMTWAQVSDLQAFKGDFSKIYNFNGIPTCVLVGPDGTIVTRNMRGLWMDKKLIELYGNKFGDKF